MIKTINSAFQLLKENLIVVQPLILFFITFGIMVPILFNQNVPVIFFWLNKIILVLFLVAFISGWFYMIKLSIGMKDKEFKTPQEKSIAQFSLLKEFFVGIGDYFLSISGMFLILVILAAIFSIAVYKFGNHYIGNLVITKEITDLLSMSAKDINAYFQVPGHITPAMVIFYKWVVLIFSGSIIFSFATLFYTPAIFYDTRNPFKALWLNIKFLFFNLFEASILFIFLLALYVALSFVNIFAANNIVMSILSLFLMLLYCTYYVMLVFVYYDEKTKNTRNSGSERVG